jgi:hypothetical protein
MTQTSILNFEGLESFLYPKEPINGNTEYVFGYINDNGEFCPVIHFLYKEDVTGYLTANGIFYEHRIN